MNLRIVFITTAVIGLAGGFWFGRNVGQFDNTAGKQASRPIAEDSAPAGNSENSSGKAQFYKESPFWEKVAQSQKSGDYVTRYHGLNAAFHDWAKADAAQALAAALNTPEVKGTGLLYPIFSLLVKREGFESSLARLEAEEDGPIKQEGYQYLAQEVFQTPSPQACMELLLERCPKDALVTAMDAGVQSWRLAASQEEVWAWIQDKLSGLDPADLPRLERAVAARTIDQNPEQGAAWLLERATDASRSEHLRTIAERWARNAPNAAGKWLQSLPKGPQNDQAVAAFSQMISRDDPESAAHWASAILQKDLRHQSLQQALNLWRQTAPAAAQAYEQSQVATP